MKCHVCRGGKLIRQQIGWECDNCRVAVLSAFPRYRIYPMPSAPASVVETPDGEWCQWNDIQEEMTALRTLAEKCRVLCADADAEIERLRAALEASERVAMMVDGLISELRAAEEKIAACEKCIGQLREGIRYYGGKDLLDKIDNDPEEVLE